MRTFVIRGKVVRKGTEEGLGGLRVEAWDKDLVISDLLGSATTSSSGTFRIVFDESCFKDLGFEGRPDIFFKVYDATHLLADTRHLLIVNVDREDIEAVIEVESPGAGLPETAQSGIRAGGNSSRSFYQAIYTQRGSSAGQKAAAVRGLEKRAFARAFKITDRELADIEQRRMGAAGEGRAGAEDDPVIRTARLIRREPAGPPGAASFKNAAGFSPIPSDDLCVLLKEIVAARREVLAGVREEYAGLVEAFSTAQSDRRPAKKNRARSRSAEAAAPFGMDRLKSWAEKNSPDSLAMVRTVSGLGEMLLSDPDACDSRSVVSAMDEALGNLERLIGVFRSVIEREPVGYLHLERVEFHPAGIERGELVYSVPLSPGEEVNLMQKEWSNTSEEFERIATDYFEGFSEEGVSEKSELSQSVNSEEKHSMGLNTSVSASASYGSVKVNTTTALNVSDSDSTSRELSRNHTAELTSKASSRTRKEQKFSFTISSKAGREDQTVRTIKNPFADRAARIDYYRLIRKWQVGLFRSGIRLTWDIAIPEPGSGLLSKLIQIHELRRQVEDSFEDLFTLRPDEIGLEGYTSGLRNYSEIASDWGVAIVEEPPQPVLSQPFVVDWHDWQDQCGGTHVLAYTLEPEIPKGYHIEGDAHIAYAFEKCPDGDIHNGYGIKVIDQTRGPNRYLYKLESTPGPEIKIDTYDKWDGRSGKLAIWVRIWKIKFFSMTIHLDAVIDQANFRAWQQQVWKTIHDGAQANFYEQRQMLKSKLARLEEELGAQDSLSLRKKEREEVMKGVLRWLLGKDLFGYFPDGVPGELESDVYEEDSGMVFSESVRETMLLHGETVKFLQHAIEWENVLFFLYPYFWCHPRRWEFKKYLEHPDPLHRAFLKSGSARVVLTIRPGFEQAFLAFINTGDTSQLPPHPYLEIGNEFCNYAKSNYPGIPPANPETNFRPLIYPSQRKAWETMQEIIACIGSYRDTNGEYPPNLGSLNRSFSDPWGREFVYKFPGTYAEYDLVCLGADGEEGGEGENADITNWAESSLVGVWYEYTPTPALDIAFGETLPAK
ncbi:MAG: type II secretion system protein GspG [Chitinispirillaceae bacterium]|nr:type II secretion system protein GspG [Chitinispirillaceae bacterium]